MIRTVVPHRTAGAAGRWLLKHEQTENGKNYKRKTKKDESKSRNSKHKAE